jgi:predicted enzyme related to lactoylglutathione lyase
MNGNLSASSRGVAGWCRAFISNRHAEWTLVLLTLLLASGSAWAKTDGEEIGQTVVGRVIFSLDEINESNANAADQAAIRAVVVQYWDSYLRSDRARITALLSKNVRRLSPRAGVVQDGVLAVISGLQKEWEAFERPKGLISEAMTLRQIDIEILKGVPHGAAARQAVVRYWVEIEGGSRWNYEDQGLVLQVFSNIDGRWLLNYQTDSWNLSYDLDEGTPGDESFDFDFVYPANDLARAVRFYTPLMGAPTFVGDGRAAFNVGGGQFILDATLLDGFATVNRSKPAGYAIFYSKNLKADCERLKARGVQFLAGTDKKFRPLGADVYAIARDNAGNVFVLMQRQFLREGGGAAPELIGFTAGDLATRNARAIVDAWLRTDAGALAKQLAPTTRWFDDLRSRVRGVDVGEKRILEALRSVYWANFDRGENGLEASMRVSALKVLPVGPDSLVSFEMALTGKGVHAYSERAFATMILSPDGRLKQFMISQNNNTQQPVIELDYVGYPTEDLQASERFYTSVVKLGKPYVDSDWRGYWSNRYVFGIFTADIEEDGIPRKGKSNGYLSVWVRSARDANSYLRKAGSLFPVVPSINSESGINQLPGYVQVYATDSEGNGLVFTEYTGRRK